MWQGRGRRGSRGNSNSEAYQWPAATGYAMSVTSVDRYAKKSGYANYGGWVDVAAPGDDIKSAFPTSTSALWSGTSMATPIVAGQAALVHGVSPTAKPSDVEGAITGTARPLNYSDRAYSGKLRSTKTCSQSVDRQGPAGPCRSTRRQLSARTKYGNVAAARRRQH